MDVQTGACAGDSRCSLPEAELWIDTLPVITRTYSAFSKLEASESSLETGQKKQTGHIKADDGDRVFLHPMALQFHSITFDSSWFHLLAFESATSSLPLVQTSSLSEPNPLSGLVSASLNWARHADNLPISHCLGSSAVCGSISNQREHAVPRGVWHLPWLQRTEVLLQQSLPTWNTMKWERSVHASGFLRSQSQTGHSVHRARMFCPASYALLTGWYTHHILDLAPSKSRKGSTEL